MKCTVFKLIGVAIVSLTIICSFLGCTEESAQVQVSLQESLEPFSKALESDDLNGMTLKIYAIDESILTSAHSTKELIDRAKKKDHGYVVTIDNATLKEHVATLRQIQVGNFELADGLNCENVRTCFVFETEEKLLEIALGGWSKEPYIFEDSETNVTVFINGVEVKLNSTLAQILRVLDSLKT